MPWRALVWLFNRTLNSVAFGITLMALIGVYIAVGSGFPSVRAWFELSDLEFFNAWPLVTMMVLLVTTLATVTWTRIPFTPPRYGVWMVHLGIITLVAGVMQYYSQKLEGLIRIPVGQSREYFYDTAERSLYAMVDGRVTEPMPLRGLPRFHAYASERGNEDRLGRRSLRDLDPWFAVRDADSGELRSRSLATALGLEQPLRVDVVGYFPYAEARSTFLPGDPAGVAGLELTASDPHGGAPLRWWLVSADAEARRIVLGEIELAHRHVGDAATLDDLERAASGLHRLRAIVAGQEHVLDVQPGTSHVAGGYRIEVERFDPAFPLAGSGQPTPMLSLMVHAPEGAPVRAFRRMVLAGLPTQTDFLLDVPGAGPMGQRQASPVDPALTIGYALSDPAGLLPRRSSLLHTLATSDDGALLDIAASVDQPLRLTRHPGPKSAIELRVGEGGASRLPLAVQYHGNLRRVDSVIETPPELRERDLSSSGYMQIVRLQLRSGDWRREVLVPFRQFPYDEAWGGDAIVIPGAVAPLRLQIGHTMRPMPARVAVDRFEVIPYAGGDETINSIMRDFRSTLTLTDRRTGAASTGQAYMNNPVYYDGGRWLFFQAAWDPEGQRWTILGVGNRPGVKVMTAGSILIAVGLLWAFYLKPVIIRRMKNKALEEARRRASLRAPQAVSAAG